MVIDLGTGVNAQIIATSTAWRFELISGVILLTLMLPLTYILAKQFDMMGPAIANLISISVYNAVRIAFLWKRYRLFPFTWHSVYIVLAAAACYGICHFLFINIHGLPGLILRSALFIILYGGIVIGFRLSPDIIPVLTSLQNRFKRKR
jgi:hypothetical protein